MHTRSQTGQSRVTTAPQATAHTETPSACECWHLGQWKRASSGTSPRWLDECTCAALIMARLLNPALPLPARGTILSSILFTFCVPSSAKDMCAQPHPVCSRGLVWCRQHWMASVCGCSEMPRAQHAVYPSVVLSAATPSIETTRPTKDPNWKSFSPHGDASVQRPNPPRPRSASR